VFCLNGHVGLIVGDGTVIHANGYHKAVTREPFSDLEYRYEQLDVERLGFRRLSNDQNALS